MSDIDQAFIQAYTADDVYREPDSNAEMPMAPSPASGFSGIPHMPANTGVPTSTGMYFSDAVSETMAGPHFRGHAQAPSSAAQNTMLASGAVLASAKDSHQRRPLSAFAAPVQRAPESFRPVLEVDAFRWPENVGELLVAHRTLMMPVVEKLLAANQAGCSMAGIAGTRPGVGCTTMQLCLAKLLVDAGKSVAIVDANFASGLLARKLGLEITAGWEDVLTGQLPLAECVVHSIGDRLALLPLAGRNDSPNELLASIQTSVSAGVLRYQYDLVLFDLGAASQPSQLSNAQRIVDQCRLDANIIVTGTSDDDATSLQQINRLLSIFGSTCLGLIENHAAVA